MEVGRNGRCAMQYVSNFKKQVGLDQEGVHYVSRHFCSQCRYARVELRYNLAFKQPTKKLVLCDGAEMGRELFIIG